MWNHAIMNAKINLHQYFIFIILQNLGIADIKCFTVLEILLILPYSLTDKDLPCLRMGQQSFDASMDTTITVRLD